MTNNDIADSLAAEHGLAKADARKFVSGVIAVIADAVARGEDVVLNGIGKFKVKDRPARQGRNPATGAVLQIAASKSLGFTPAKTIKDRLNG